MASFHKIIIVDIKQDFLFLQNRQVDKITFSIQYNHLTFKSLYFSLKSSLFELNDL